MRDSGTRGAPARLAVRVAGLALLLFSVSADSPRAQDVVQLLVEQRRRAVLGAAVASALPPEPRGLYVYPQTDSILLRLDAREARRLFVADSVTQARADSAEAARPEPSLDWRKVAPGAQAGFLADYRETLWRAVGVHPLTPIDTLMTLELRGRLTQRFGTPTRNAAAARQERYAGSEEVQFEYWLVANDSIPVLVMDTRGPFGRGLLIAADERQPGVFEKVKADLARLLLSVSPTVEFVDYYQHPEARQWYRAGYDGTAFFTEAIRRPRWHRNFGGEKWVIHR